MSVSLLFPYNGNMNNLLKPVTANNYILANAPLIITVKFSAGKKILSEQ
jgi:hypothetical protein